MGTGYRDGEYATVRACSLSPLPSPLVRCGYAPYDTERCADGKWKSPNSSKIPTGLSTLSLLPYGTKPLYRLLPDATGFLFPRELPRRATDGPRDEEDSVRAFLRLPPCLRVPRTFSETLLLLLDNNRAFSSEPEPEGLIAGTLPRLDDFGLTDALRSRALESGLFVRRCCRGEELEGEPLLCSVAAPRAVSLCTWLSSSLLLFGWVWR